MRSVPTESAIRRALPGALCLFALGSALIACEPGKPARPEPAAAGPRPARLLTAEQCAEAVGLASGGAAAGERAALPDIVLIQVDTLRADHLGAYGYARATSPNLDRFAKHGVRFEHAFATWPETSQSLAGMLTSSFSDRTGVRQIRSALPLSALTLAEVLDCAGYATAGLVANGNAGREFQFDQGFDEYFEFWKERRGATGGQRGSDVAERVGGAAIEWLEARSALRRAAGDRPVAPFFLWTLFIDPHGPYDPPAPFDRMFEGDAIAAADEREIVDKDTQPYQWLGHGRVRDYVAAYDGEIAYWDAWFGRLLETLEALPGADDALVIFTADHGEALGEHGLYFQHGTSAQRAQSHVPLIVRAKALAPGVVAAPVSLVDLAPTLLELAGLPIPVAFDGQSLAPLARGETTAGRPVVTESKHELALTDEGFRMIVDSRSRRIGLYAHRSDPDERENLVTRHPEVAARLEQQTTQWLAAHGEAPARRVAEQRSEPVSPATLEQLKHLGYVD